MLQANQGKTVNRILENYFFFLFVLCVCTHTYACLNLYVLRTDARGIHGTEAVNGTLVFCKSCSHFKTKTASWDSRTFRNSETTQLHFDLNNQPAHKVRLSLNKTNQIAFVFVLKNRAGLGLGI